MKQAPVAYQVYSARREAEADLLSVLRALKEMGYDGVEFAGLYGHDPQEVRKMLADCGLQGISCHVSYNLIVEDMQGIIDCYKTVGCKYIAIPALPAECRPGQAGFSSVIRTIYRFGQLCRDQGIQLLYHNHDFEFVPVSGQYALDFLYSAVPEELLQSEIDTCWVKYAGEDPCAYLRKYTGRAPIVHLKDYVGRREGSAAPYGLLGESEAQQNGNIAFEFRPYGHGCQDAAAVVDAGLEAGAQWFVIEQDESVGRTPLEAARMSIDTLRRIGLKA